MATKRRPLGYGTGLVGTGAIAAPISGVPPVDEARMLYTPGAPVEDIDEKRRQAAIALGCPTSAKCDEVLGDNVVAYPGKWGLSDLIGRRSGASVVKVFRFLDEASRDKAQEKINKELSAYGALERLYKQKGGLKPLWAEQLMSDQWNTFSSMSLRIERYTPWKTLRSDARWGEAAVSAWSLVGQVAKMHESGIAHGELSGDTIGYVGSVGSGRFVVSGSSQVVSPLSEFYEGVRAGNAKYRDAFEQVRVILRGLVKAKCNGGLRCWINLSGHIDGINDEVDELKKHNKINALNEITQAHMIFVEALRDDVNALRGIFQSRLQSADPKTANALWYTFKEIETVRLGKDPSGRNGKDKGNKKEPGVGAGISGCAECGASIDGGLHGEVYHHRESALGKVVKVFNPTYEDYASKEALAYELLNKISASDPSFRSLKARLLPRMDGESYRLEVDKLRGVLKHYTGRANAEANMKRDGVSMNDFRDILRQFDILHRYGVAHGDAHDGNIGFVDGGFVIVDPTYMEVSPLSELYFGSVAQDGKRVLDALRKATKQGGPMEEPVYRYTLNKRIVDLDTDNKIRAFLSGFRDLSLSGGVRDEDIRNARMYIRAHNDVVRLMMFYEKGDRQRVKSALRDVARSYLPGLLDGWRDPP